MARKKVTKNGTKKAPKTPKVKGTSSRLTPEIIESILAEIAQGKSTNSSLIAHGIPHGTWYDWTETEEGRDKYARARMFCAHAHADAIMELVDDARNLRLPPDAARVAIDGAKWTAARLHFREYGDKQQQEHTGNVSIVVKTNCKVGGDG